MTVEAGKTCRGIDLTAPGGVEALLTLHRSVFGPLVMSADAGDAGSGSGGQGGDGGTGGSGDAGNGGSSGGQGGGSGTGDPKREDVDPNDPDRGAKLALVEERATVRRLTRELADARAAEDERRQRDEAEQTRAVRTELTGQLEAERNTLTALRGQLIARDARDLAVAEGVAPERWAAFVKHVDLTGLEPGQDGSVAADKLRERITAGLEEVPEFRTVTGGHGRREPQGGSGAGAGQVNDNLDAAVARALAQMGGS